MMERVKGERIRGEKGKDRFAQELFIKAGTLVIFRK